MSASATQKPAKGGRGERALIEQLERIAFADVRRMCKPTGEPLPLDEIPDEDAVAIQEVRRREWTNKDGRPGGETILRLHDKIKALQLLGDNLGAWTAAARPTGTRVFVLMPGQSRPIELSQDGRPLELAAGDPLDLGEPADGAESGLG